MDPNTQAETIKAILRLVPTEELVHAVNDLKDIIPSADLSPLVRGVCIENQALLRHQDKPYLATEAGSLPSPSDFVVPSSATVVSVDFASCTVT
ncbi:hypothetical protein KIPB_012403, partial [Kipferlia bialata]|eukprot:g12403.t1